jgi:K+-sensing histidine kinase KdpD
MALSCFPEGTDIVVRVDDDGAGIGEEDRWRMFERFVPLDDARSRDTGGAGLGLTIVAGAARAHGGTASVECSPQGGARFEMRVPQQARCFLKKPSGSFSPASALTRHTKLMTNDNATQDHPNTQHHPRPE